MIVRITHLNFEGCPDRLLNEFWSLHPFSSPRSGGSQNSVALGSRLQRGFEGVSTRCITKVMEELCGFEVSSGQVSNLNKQLDAEFEKWWARGDHHAARSQYPHRPTTRSPQRARKAPRDRFDSQHRMEVGSTGKTFGPSPRPLLSLVALRLESAFQRPRRARRSGRSCRTASAHRRATRFQGHPLPPSQRRLLRPRRTSLPQSQAHCAPSFPGFQTCPALTARFCPALISSPKGGFMSLHN